MSAIKMIPILHLNGIKPPFSRVHALSDRNKYVLIHLHRLILNHVYLSMSMYASVSVCTYAHREHPGTS